MNIDASVIQQGQLGNMRASERLGNAITDIGTQEIAMQNEKQKRIDEAEQKRQRDINFTTKHMSDVQEIAKNDLTLRSSKLDKLAGILEEVETPEDYERFKATARLPFYGINVPEKFDLGFKQQLINEAKGLSGKLKEIKTLSGGGANVWAQKSAELTAINAMEEGPDKEQAKQDFLLKSSYPTYYNASPEKVAQEGKIAEARATAQIGPGLQLAQGKMGIELEGEKKKKDITNEPSVPEVRKQKATIENTLSVFNEISTNVDKFTGPAGAVSAAIPGTDAYTYRKKVESFINGMVIPLLAQQKGPQTDTDMRNMRSAMTILGDVGVQLNREQFKKELLRVKDVIDRNAKAFSKEGIKTEQITVSDTSAIDAFFKARKK